jgi:hypothetical protein
MFRREPDRLTPWVLAIGAVASASAVSLGVIRLLRQRRRAQRPVTTLDHLEESAVDVLRRDAQTRACAIDVAALAPGIIELTGTVPTYELGQRAARLLHSLAGVNTVINRLETGALEAQLADNRDRRSRGAPETEGRQWYGFRVGTGRRRQSADTEPARDDDTLKRRTRELEVSAADIADGVAAADESDAERDDTMS